MRRTFARRPLRHGVCGSCSPLTRTGHEHELVSGTCRTAFRSMCAMCVNNEVRSSETPAIIARPQTWSCPAERLSKASVSCFRRWTATRDRNSRPKVVARISSPRSCPASSGYPVCELYRRSSAPEHMLSIMVRIPLVRTQGCGRSWTKATPRAAPWWPCCTSVCRPGARRRARPWMVSSVRWKHTRERTRPLHSDC